MILEGALKERMQSGRQAIFIIFQEESKGLGVPISLDEFRGAVQALERL